MTSRKRHRPRQSDRGFSLLELIVAIAIIFIIIAITIPVISSVRERVRLTHCGSNLRQLRLAVQFYQDSYNGLLPYATKPTNMSTGQVDPFDDFADTLSIEMPVVETGNEYARHQLFACPSDRTKFKLYGVSYRYVVADFMVIFKNMDIDPQRQATTYYEDPANTAPVLSDFNRFHWQESSAPQSQGVMFDHSIHQHPG
jgi:prepilin-type N-terminal cleavage/methylation domain-containing protein